MRTSAFLYPWDVVGDPGAADRLAGLGVQQVTLASAYHSTRALTPRHPGSRIVTARYSAVYYPPDPTRWSGRALRPRPQAWVPRRDAFAEAATALRDAGLAVHSWVVLAHNSLLGGEHPRTTVRNAYGERYPWALCIAQQEVVDYCADLAAEAAPRPGAEGTELESCGWYGLAHLHGHDKIAGVSLGGAAHYLMSLCFCSACLAGYRDCGADPVKLRHAVREALEPMWRGRDPRPADDRRQRAADDPADARTEEWVEVERLLGTDLAKATLAHRTRAARHLQESVVAAVRSAAGPDFRVMLHADPAIHRCGPNPGVDLPHVLDTADGLVLPCSVSPEDRASVLQAATRARRPGTLLAANLTMVAGMGGRPDALVRVGTEAAALGADELRLYHAGLASDADLAQARAALSELSAL